MYLGQLCIAVLLIFYHNVRVGVFLLWQILIKGASILNVKSRTAKPDALTQGVRDNVVRINGINLHYVEAGDRSKPLMLFVHGFPEFWYSWRYQIKEFSKDHWVVAVDLRGYNESDKPADTSAYALDHLVTDLHELIKHLNKSPLLVCHDWGSVIGFEYVLRHMDTVRGYVMLCAPPRQIHKEVSRTCAEQYRMMWYIFFFQGRYLPELVLRSFDLRMYNELRSRYTSPEDIEVFKYVFGQRGALTPPINYYRANFFSRVSRHPRPTEYKKGLFLLAENDRYISTSCGPRTEKFIPNLTYQLLPDVDHFCQQTSPDVVNQAIRLFLTQDEEK